MWIRLLVFFHHSPHDRVCKSGSTWRQERTYEAQTDIDRHLYLLPRDVQQRHHNQAPGRLQAASGRAPGGRDTRYRSPNENLVVYPHVTDNSAVAQYDKIVLFHHDGKGHHHATEPVVLPTPAGRSRVAFPHDPSLVARPFQGHTS